MARASIAVFALLAMLLETGIIQERFEPGLFRLLVGRAERMVIDFQKPRHIAVGGL